MSAGVDLFRDTVTIIAEVGTNHNGELDIAKKLIEISAECGAHLVKFQSFLVDELLSVNDPNFDLLKKLQLPKEWYPVLIKHCRDHGVEFLSTATNDTTLKWMESFGVIAYKVASCNITHYPLFDRLLKIRKPVIISTGLASLDDIIGLDLYFKKQNFFEYAFLHCVSRYPTKPEDLRLKNIRILKELFTCPIGFSDHSLSPFLPVAAVSLGATIIEKHISLNKKGSGMDHQVAILPDDFKIMCNAIRDAEKALTFDIRPDKENMFIMRRSLHYVRDLHPGDIIREDDVKIIRPEDGLLPGMLNNVLGKTLSRPVVKNQAVQWKDLDINE